MSRSYIVTDYAAHGFDEADIEKLRADMAAYRTGEALPMEYRTLHERVARHQLQWFAKEQKVRVIATEMIHDGWVDGMQVLRVVAEDRVGILRDYRWSDANGGSWFEQLPSGGQRLVHKVGSPGRF